ncbi:MULTISPECIES: DUF1415 domain-containing protein [Deefgea]|uniref:DUF1415 family protein n=1 Tax=Deefgea chitinilytica TaxID=570276 RepID=A0ABS2CBI4_9NEIS|nr:MULTISPECIES: DUF1415 domain-containing protein [Deefgea]MBM5571387.1 DUF1415 family protein [Deefgea chitinilytica]MBM9888620.1 DUF1415 domain-containing protein [Deefgea sp. CFH1-16]
MDHDHIIKTTQHWLENAVIGLNLCPFAKAVFVKNQIRYVVSNAKHLDGFLDDLDRELDFLAQTPAAEVDTTLLIHPTLFPDFEIFNDVQALADEIVAEHELEGILQVASFHPEFQFDDTELDDISNYTNRAPFPILHLLREDSIAKAVEAFPNPDVIYERNIETLQKLGLAGWMALGLQGSQK